jgi:hypothetical protein
MNLDRIDPSAVSVHLSPLGRQIQTLAPQQEASPADRRIADRERPAAHDLLVEIYVC